MNSVLRTLVPTLSILVALNMWANPAAAQTAPAPGFDITKAPVVSPTLGAFPYFSLMRGYKRGQPASKDLQANKDADFDKYEFFDGRKSIPVEGRITTIDAEGAGASAIEICKNYESLIKGLGGVTVFEGTGKPLVMTFKPLVKDKRHRDPIFRDDQLCTYVVRMPDKEIWVEAYTSAFSRRKGRYYLTVVEKKGLPVKVALLGAEEMKRELDAKGHVALYINFDFNKADIKPEAQPTINEILKLLTNNPSLNLTIEGHTDNIGTPDYNKKLSDDRAKSVMAALTSKGIEGRRLKAVGYGLEKPIADNGTEEGRAKNRRVELVKMSVP